MPYHLLDNSADVGIALEAWEDTLPRLAETVCDAVMNVVLEDISEIDEKWAADFSVSSEQLDKLLYELVREQVLYLETGRLLSRARQIQLITMQNMHYLTGKFYGEPLDINRHDLLVNLKTRHIAACTLHQKGEDWYAHLAFNI